MQPETGGTPGYEFNAAENKIVGRLATLMKVTGIVQMAVGVLQLGAFAAKALALRENHPIQRFGVDVPVSAAFIVGGLLMLLAAPPFKLVVDTVGNDIHHIMTACGKLSALMITLVAALSVVTVGWIIMLIVFLATGVPLVGGTSEGGGS